MVLLRILLIHHSRHIANTYWPLPTDNVTHLKIHAMYHNALYLRARRALLQASTPRVDTPAESLAKSPADSSPESFAEPSAPLPSRSPSPLCEASDESSDASGSNAENIPPPPPSPSFRRKVATAAGNITEKLAEKFNGLVHKGSEFLL